MQEKTEFYGSLGKSEFPKANSFLEKVRKENEQKKAENGFLSIGDITKEIFAGLGVIYED